MRGFLIEHPPIVSEIIMLPSTMKSSRRIKFGPSLTDPPSQTIPDSRRRRQLKGILKKNDRDTKPEPPVTMASKNLILGQVKILKRGEVLSESTRILKEVNSNKDVVAKRETSEAVINGGRFLLAKKKEKKKLMCSNPKFDVAVSSTHRMGRDVETVSKQMKSITECFAGSVSSDSPPPSSVPLPGFLKRNLLNL